MREEMQNRGIRLLKKGKRGLFRLIFSRIGIVTILIFAEIFMIFSMFQWLSDFFPQFYTIMWAFTIGMVIYLLNIRMNPTAKITWLILIMITPILGAVFFAYTRSNIGHIALKKRMEEIIEETDSLIEQNPKVLELLAEEKPEAVTLARYITTQKSNILNQARQSLRSC